MNFFLELPHPIFDRVDGRPVVNVIVCTVHRSLLILFNFWLGVDGEHSVCLERAAELVELFGLEADELCEFVIADTERSSC